MINEYIFVYGTLRKHITSQMQRVMRRYCEYIGQGKIQGKLYEVSGYPGAIESDNRHDQVYGELYRIVNSNTLLQQLDEYEGCSHTFAEPHEYVRKKIPVILHKESILNAWVYIYNHETSKLEQIKSGNYLSFLNNRCNRMPETQCA